MTDASTSARYRFGDAARSGVLLGLSVRQPSPLVPGCVWLTLCLVARQPLVGMRSGLAAGVVACVRAVAARPAVRGRRPRGPPRRGTGCCVVAPWVRAVRCSAPDPVSTIDLPPALAGLELLEIELDVAADAGRRRRWCVTGRAGTVSIVLAGAAPGSRWRRCASRTGCSPAWGAALAPFARARCPVSRVTWQEWSHPVGVAGHREFLAGLDRPAPLAGRRRTTTSCSTSRRR